LSFSGAAAQTGGVFDTLAADGRFIRFLDLIARAGLADPLRGDGPFTVFAPTDQVFGGASGHGSRLEDLLNQSTGDRGPGSGDGGASGASPDPIRLTAFVGYFIVPGQALTLAQLTAPGNLHPQPMNGTPIAARARRPGEMPTVSGAEGLNITRPFRVVQADIPAANGITHALGGVPFP
jgi:uncharacterized surface protein with fasciclin (FAS1) repeats